jgi:hypothetical protein
MHGVTSYARSNLICMQNLSVFRALALIPQCALTGGRPLTYGDGRRTHLLPFMYTKQPSLRVLQITWFMMLIKIQVPLVHGVWTLRLGPLECLMAPDVVATSRCAQHPRSSLTIVTSESGVAINADRQGTSLTCRLTTG